MNFTDSETCRSQVHCDACRGDRSFRVSLSRAFSVPDVDFECPHGRGPVRTDSADAIVEIEPVTSKDRLTVCRACEHATLVSLTVWCGAPIVDALRGDKQTCGCLMNIKARLPGATCPLGKW